MTVVKLCTHTQPEELNFWAQSAGVDVCDLRRKGSKGDRKYVSDGTHTA